jgi:tetratricopeptide (TPR) repeat protein
MKPSRQLKALREVLRHLDHPDRLRENPLVAWQFHDGTGPEHAAMRIRIAIEHALEELPPRQREILRRCDLEGESHPHAIARLAVSERHFYRERRTATERLAGILATTPKQPSAFDGEADRLTLKLCLAEAAQQLGNNDGARRVLESSLADASPYQRLWLECRLAEVCCEAEATQEACRHLEAARCLEMASTDGDTVSGAQIAATEALIEWSLGNDANAVERASCAADMLRATMASRPTARASEALALALLVLSQRDLATGRWIAARRAALEARDLLSSSDSMRAVLAVRASLTATDAYMLDPGRIDDAALEYRQHYRNAIARGLSLEATRIGRRLGLFHRFAQKPRHSAEALERILPIARYLLPSEDRAEMCLDLASAYTACGKPARARDLITEARMHALPGGFFSALCDIMAAAASLSERDYVETLRLSSDAVGEMQHLNRQGAVGSALRLQAQAHHAMGNLPLARALIGEALMSIEPAGHPYAIARTHRAAARITGRSIHRRRADEIFAQLRPTTPMATYEKH